MEQQVNVESRIPEGRPLLEVVPGAILEPSVRRLRAPRLKQRGRAGLLLVALVLLAACLAGLYYFSLGEAERPLKAGLNPESAESAPAPESAEGAVEMQAETLEAPEHETDRLAFETDQSARVALEKSFTGTGSITAIISVPPDVEFPGYWQLILEPATMLQGRETAVHRMLEFERGQFEIEKRAYEDTVEVTVDDLPLGGYAVYVVAPDMNCTKRETVLFKYAGRPDAPGRQSVRLTMKLEPAGFVDGSVIDGDGLAAEECLVTLESIPDNERLTARTGPDGLFLFPTVMEGRYRMIVGHTVHPLIDVQEVIVKGRATKIPEVRLPNTASLRFVIVGTKNERVGDVVIRGSGSSGDPIDLVSDGAGEAYARYLRPGRYRIRAQHPDGRTGKLTIAVNGSERYENAEIRVR